MIELPMRENLIVVAGMHYRRASWTRRISARFIDLSLLVVLGAFANESIEPFVVIGAIVYLLFGEWLLKGRGIGKRMLGIKTIDAKHGRGPGPIQDLIRHRYLFFCQSLIFNPDSLRYAPRVF